MLIIPFSGCILSNEAGLARRPGHGSLAVQGHLRALLAPGPREAARHEGGRGAAGRALAVGKQEQRQQQRNQYAAARVLEHQGVVARE